MMTSTALLPGAIAPTSRATETGVFRCVTLNTHRGSGPDLACLRRTSEPEETRRLEILHDTKAYTYWIAEWLQSRRDAYDAVGLQEVWGGVLGLGTRPFSRFAQDDYYRVLSGYGAALSHRVGFAGFRYANVLLLREALASGAEKHANLPCRVFLLAACGFTLAPVVHRGRTVWIGNTHLHAYNPKSRMRQAAAIAREVRRLGDQPVLFLGDLNTVPPGCKDGDFTEGDRDARSYKDDRTFEILAKAGLRTVRHDDSARFWTYPTGAANRTLDYILASRHWDVDRYRVVRGFRLSDHEPVEASYRLSR